ncbi:hypothetical protein [Natrarchaeobaculum aegyptiacum]|uniref:hypothetical protein n=1 Tax=Natrarchaeobaculum aegyptiacum TaxID=745377 RepID=UPI0012600C84|nr:hypothetical protein [Natrarchaeobaculum aegyptiacum]
MKRRSVLGTPILALALITPGCFELTGSSETQYSFAVYNHSEDEHTFTIRIASDIDDYYIHEDITLEERGAETDVSIDGIPSRISIQVDTNSEYEFPWPAGHSDSEKKSNVANIYYTPHDDQEVMVYGEH